MELEDSVRRYVLDQGVEVYPAGEEVIAVHTGRDEVHRLNLTAAQVLDACDGRSAREIAAGLRESYPEVPEGRVDEDVEQILSVLVAKGVVRALAPGEDLPPAGSD